MEKKYTINYLPVAEQDLTEIIQYIMLDDPSAAHNMLNRFDEAISVLEFFPNSGSVPNDLRLQSLNYRMLIVENYLVFYTIIEDTVEFRRILHGKRKYNFLL
ncbi:type II toxin-antitoxin system RelE/ParE family toxin [Paenibacillus macerans]|uniref:type II toxin-antitoxin system RelE/ParE family toxin n=1 Tax=Paenibacillus macerans TaxID=44252 RepID=UPI003D316628